MRSILSKTIISFVFLGLIFFTADTAEAQRKAKVTKKTKVTSKAKVSGKTAMSVKTPVPVTPQAVVPNRTTQSLLARIETNTGIYRRELVRAINRSNLNGTDSEDSINAYTSDFENATKTLRSMVNSGSDSVADVQDVLNRADFVQSFLRENPLSPAVQSQWKILRDNLLTLANIYNVSWNVNAVPNTGAQANNAGSTQNSANRQPVPSAAQPRNASSARFDSMLTGTYRLNVSRSDNMTAILDRALGANTPNNNQNNAAQEERRRRNLERRLTATETMVIEKRNNQVTIASDLSPQVTFAADNVARTEVNPNGRNVSVKAAALSNVLEISYEGDRVNDFFLTFMPIDNGQLRVTRRLYLEERDQTVTITSVYDKILPTADFSVVKVNTNTGQNNAEKPAPTDFVVPNGTQVIGVLSSALSTQTAREGDRFTLEISSPSQYAGAIIEGYVSNTQQAAQVTDRAQVTFNFDKIQMRNGTTYSFNGFVDVVRLTTGETIRVVNEAAGNVNEPTRPAPRQRIGGSLGSIIGAILGGGQPAPVEAPAVGSTGSGTILLQGYNNVVLQTGSEFRIVSSAPANLKAGN